MSRSFTWFEKFTDMYVTIEDLDQRGMFAMAIIDYGACGIEPELPYPLSTFFASIKADIDNSVSSRMRNKGGRPCKSAASPAADASEAERSEETEGSEEMETEGFGDSETGGFEDGETGGSEDAETCENPLLYKPKPKPSPSPKEDILSCKPPYEEIIAHLNEKAKTNFKHTSKSTRSLINGRFREGYALEDFRAVIDAKCADWLYDSRMREYLRPKTLFAASNFEGYLQQARRKEADGYAKYN